MANGSCRVWVFRRPLRFSGCLDVGWVCYVFISSIGHAIIVISHLHLSAMSCYVMHVTCMLCIRDSYLAICRPEKGSDRQKVTGLASFSYLLS